MLARSASGSPWGTARTISSWPISTRVSLAGSVGPSMKAMSSWASAAALASTEAASWLSRLVTPGWARRKPASKAGRSSTPRVWIAPTCSWPRAERASPAIRQRSTWTMSSTLTGPYPPVLVRADEAEHLDLIGHVLLVDSSATAGALSSHRVALGRGADGAVPHRHDNSSELFYILDGAFDLLAAGDVVTARTGDLLVVPPGVAHAFAAHHDSTAERWSSPHPASNDSTTSATSSAGGKGVSRLRC